MGRKHTEMDTTRYGQGDTRHGMAWTQKYKQYFSTYVFIYNPFFNELILFLTSVHNHFGKVMLE